MATKTKFPDYKGYAITYNESENIWDGEAAGTAVSLKALKGKIDKAASASRKLVGVKALFVEDGSWRSAPAIKEATVTSIAEASWGVGQAWITFTSKSGHPERSKVGIDNLYPIERRAELEEYVRKIVAARQADKEAQKFKDAIVAFTKETLKEATTPKEEKTK